MPHKSWQRALAAYYYPVNLRDYEGASQFPGYFDIDLVGDRHSTISFEDRFRGKAPKEIEVLFEVIYWKLYSQPPRRDKTTSAVVAAIVDGRVTAGQLWNATNSFITSPSIGALKEIRGHLGFRAPVLPVSATLPAFACPERFPMVDNRVARWVNENLVAHSANRKCILRSFKMTATSLQDNDWEAYLSWVYWCREVATLLTKLTGENWRARDVEMAVFQAQSSKDGFRLDVLA